MPSLMAPGCDKKNIVSLMSSRSRGQHAQWPTACSGGGCNQGPWRPCRTFARPRNTSSKSEPRDRISTCRQRRTPTGPSGNLDKPWGPRGRYLSSSWRPARALGADVSGGIWGYLEVFLGDGSMVLWCSTKRNKNAPNIMKVEARARKAHYSFSKRVKIH